MAGNANDGRLLSVDRLQINNHAANVPQREDVHNVASLVRELLYDHAAEQ